LFVNHRCWLGSGSALPKHSFLQFCREPLGSFALPNPLRRGYNMQLVQSILLSSILLVFATKGTQAQESDSSCFHDGTYSLSGSITFSHTTSSASEESTTDIAFAPLYLHFLTSRFALGGQIDYLFHKTSSAFVNSEEFSFGIGPQFRYYLFAHPICTFLSATAIVTGGGRTSSGFTYSSPGTALTSFNLGADFFLAKTLSLEPFIQYQFRFAANSQSKNTISFGFSLAHFVFDQ
jgi:hypothetical protein